MATPTGPASTLTQTTTSLTITAREPLRKVVPGGLGDEASTIISANQQDSSQKGDKPTGGLRQFVDSGLATVQTLITNATEGFKRGLKALLVDSDNSEVEDNENDSSDVLDEAQAVDSQKPSDEAQVVEPGDSKVQEDGEKESKASSVKLEENKVEDPLKPSDGDTSDTASMVAKAEGVEGESSGSEKVAHSSKPVEVEPEDSFKTVVADSEEKLEGDDADADVESSAGGGSSAENSNPATPKVEFEISSSDGSSSAKSSDADKAERKVASDGSEDDTVGDGEISA